MRRHLLLTLCLLPLAAQAQVYVDTARSEPYLPLAAIPGIQNVTPLTFSNADNGAAIISTLPFVFNYFGVDYTRVNLGSNGLMTFGTEAATSANNAAPGASTSAPNTWIAPLWDDLIHPSTANARWGVVGTAPNRAVVIEAGPASRRTATTGTLYYQIWLYEGFEGHFEYRATGDPAAVLNASIGYEGGGGRRGLNAPACAIANGCTDVPLDTTFVTRRARPPELTGTLTVSARGSFPGVPVDATATLRNLGVDTATSVMATIYLSANNSLDASDVIVGSIGPLDVDASGVGTTTTTQIIVPASIAPGDYYVIFHVDSADEWAEVDEADNVLTLTGRFATAHELRPSGLTIRAPVPAASGDPLSLNFTIQNDGIPVAGPLSVEIYASTDRALSATDVLIGQLTPTLSGADPQTLIIELPLPALPEGRYYPIVVVDVAGDYPEILETNNTYISGSVFFVGIDFTIPSITVPAQLPPGVPAAVRTRLDSVGAPYVGPVSYELFASTDTTLDANDVPLGAFTAAWNQDNLRDDTQMLTFPSAPGRYYVIGRIDPANALMEIDETNNTRVSSVAGFNAPDLSVTALSFTPLMVEPSVTATLTATLRSLGLTFADYVPYSVHLSRDSTLDAGDLLLITSSTTFAGTTRTLSVPFQIPAGVSPGSYRLIASVDPADVIPEAFENNNVFTATARLAIPGAELEVISVAGTSTAVLGVPYPVTLVVHNAGAIEASGFSYAYYVSTNPLIRLTDTRVFTSATTSVAAGASRTYVDTVMFPPATATSTVYLGVIVDVFGAVPEVSEVDNVGRVPTPIRVEVPRPNLVAQSLSLSATGRTLSLRRSIANDGSADARIELAYYLSTNEAISVADVEVGRFTVTVGAGETNTATDTVIVADIVAAGRYTVGVVADPDDVADETQEDDNVAIAPAIELVATMLQVLTERLPEARVGVPYRATLSATGGIAYAWSIVADGLPSGLSLDGIGGVISGTPSETGRFPVTIAVSSGGARGERALEVAVAGVPPPLAVLTTALPGAINGRAYSASLLAIGGAAPLRWSSPDLPAGLQLSEAGVISGMASTSARVTVVVTDALGAAAQRTLSLQVSDSAGALAITTLALPEATVGVEYCSSGPVILQAIGGQRPYAWALDGGADGLMLSSGGQLCGVAASAGELLIDVRATDAGGLSVRAPLVVTVRAASGLGWASTGLPGGTVGTAYAATLEATRGRPPYRFSLLPDGGALPPGLGLDNGGGISGAPTLEGTFSFRVLVTDADDAVAVQPLFITVLRPAPQQPEPSPTPTPAPEASGCSCGTSDGGGSPSGLAALAALLLAMGGRRRAR